MNKSEELLDNIACAFLKFLVFIAGIVPVEIALWFGRRFGDIAYYVLNMKRRRVAYANLKAALFAKIPCNQRNKIIRRAYQHYMQTMMEVLYIPYMDKKYINKYVEIDGFENIENALKRGKGVISLTAHFGNWELSAIASAIKGFPINVVAREQKYKKLDDLLKSHREAKGCKVIMKGMALREVIRSLRKNAIVGMLVDQDAGKTGIFVNFFNRPASTPVGVISFAIKTDCKVIPAFIRRIKGPYHHIEIYKPIDMERTDNDYTNNKINLQKFANILENQITKYPDQWLWPHKRWKSTPVRHILVLTDDKAGHINQSKAVVKVLKQEIERRNADFKDKEIKDFVRIKEVKVKFKNKFTRIILPLFINCPWFSMQGSMLALEMCLQKDSYKELMNTYSDITVSAGSSLSAVNALMKKENLSNSLCIMKPGIVSKKRFNVIIATKHDNIKKADNVVLTIGAPNLIDDKALEKFKKEIASPLACNEALLSLQGGQSLTRQSGVYNVGLLIGGNTKNYSIEKDNIKTIIDGLLKEKEINILSTSSRRTPVEIDNVLKKKLEGNDKCSLLVIASQSNLKDINIVGKILALSNVVIVSPESISMISEAASSGKNVLVFSDNIEKLDHKHRRFINNMLEGGYIELVLSSNIAEKVLNLKDSLQPAKKLNDNGIILEAVKRLL